MDNPNSPGYEARRARQEAMRALARVITAERLSRHSQDEFSRAFEECLVAMSEIPMVQAWLWCSQRILDGLLWLSVKVGKRGETHET